MHYMPMGQSDPHCDDPHCDDRNEHCLIEHGVPTPCPSPQNVYFQTGKCFNVQNP